jgi:hypothetical protein
MVRAYLAWRRGPGMDCGTSVEVRDLDGSRYKLIADPLRQKQAPPCSDPKPCNVDATFAGLASGDSGQRSPTC